MKRFTYLPLPLLAMLAACGSSPELPPDVAPPSGKVVKVMAVIDGDTLAVADSMDQPYTLGLRGVDAPERDQPFGPEAARCLESMIGGKVVRLGDDVRERDGQFVTEVYYSAESVPLVLVERGCAWWDKSATPYDFEMGSSEERARRYRRGLWQADAPVPPWDWRAR